MSDMSGLYELTIFSEVLAQARQLLDAGQPLLVTVDCRMEADAIRLTAQTIDPLDGAVAHAAAWARRLLRPTHHPTPASAPTQPPWPGTARHPPLPPPST